MRRENWFLRISRRIVVILACVFLAVVGIGWVVSKVWLTQTESPTAEQIAKCRHILCINPELEIEPLGYESWKGVGDWTHGFKFIAKTEDPAALFDMALIDSRRFSADYDDRSMDRGRSSWWDLPSHGFSGGGRFEVKRDNVPWYQDIWYRDNSDGTILVYVYSESG
ncbi:MAG: hypothetical protein AAGA96_10150 [Verrucomicrobiota bacterium]